jgi:hypothetical protein
MLGLLAVFAVSAVASASASAAECKKEANKKFVFCAGTAKTLSEGNHTLKIAGSGEDLLSAAGIKIKCKTIEPTETVLNSTSGVVTFGKFILTFTGCTVTEGEHCVLENATIVTEPLNGKAIAKEEVQFYPEKGTLFATIKINSSGGTCLVAGSDKVVAKEGLEKEGPQCGVPTAETAATSHLVECGSKASHLKFAGKEATFTGNFTATYTEAYSIIEGV